MLDLLQFTNDPLLARRCDALEGLRLVVDLERCSPATRAWCLYEWDHTVFLHGLDALNLTGMSAEDRGAIVKSIDIGQSECEDPSDKVMILQNIIDHYGSLDKERTQE